MDISFLFANWLNTDCSNSNNWREGTDLYQDLKVNISDLAIVSNNWLETN